MIQKIGAFFSFFLSVAALAACGPNQGFFPGDPTTDPVMSCGNTTTCDLANDFITVQTFINNTNSQQYLIRFWRFHPATNACIKSVGYIIGPGEYSAASFVAKAVQTQGWGSLFFRGTYQAASKGYTCAAQNTSYPDSSWRVWQQMNVTTADNGDGA